MLNYGLQFSSVSRHEFITTLLVPKTKRKECQARISEFLKTTRDKNIHVYPIYLKSPNYRLRNLLNAPTALRDFSLIFETLKELRPDVAICYYVLDAYPFILLRRILDYSLCVVAMGGDINLHRCLFYRSMRNIIYRGSDLVFAVSHALQDKIEEESGHQPIIARTGVDANFFKPLDSRLVLRDKWRFSPEDQVLLMVCNLVKHKGVDIAIRALSMLRKQQPSIKLAIVGHGPEERTLMKLASRLQLESNVLFLGVRNRQELLELYNVANVFVLASSSEGLPFVLLEAMACGRICVATDVGGIPAVITQGENGFLVPSGNPIAIANAIETVLCLSEEKTHSVESQARKTIENGYDFRSSVSTMIRAIEDQKS